MSERLKFLQVREDTHHQVKSQAENDDLSIKDYVQALADTNKDNRMTNIDPEIIDNFMEQSQKAGMFPSDYLDLILRLCASQASHKRDVL